MQLSNTLKLVLGAVLVAVAAFNPFVDVNQTTHTAIALVTTSFLAVGIGPELGSQFGKLIPLPVAHALGLAVAVGNALVQTTAISDAWKAIIGAALAFLVGIGIQPVAIQTATPAPKRSHHKKAA